MRRGPCVFVSIEAGRSPDAEKKVRGLARRVKSDIALRQRRAGMRRIQSVSVFEVRARDGSPKLPRRSHRSIGEDDGIGRHARHRQGVAQDLPHGN